ncbi:MAG: SH3 domain-containing protein [Chloroflexi bacterium]|nr:SH3 domain-containing protein [Chloroflexota bacterium]
MIAPAPNSAFLEGTDIYLHAIAQDDTRGVGYIEFAVNSQVKGRVDAAEGGQPFLDATIPWTVAGGVDRREVSATAYSPDGQQLGSVEGVGVTIVPAESAQPVRLLAPVNGSVFAQGTEVQFHAFAVDPDPDRRVDRVEFRLDDNPPLAAPITIQRDDLATYVTSWPSGTPQTHRIIVQAFRADGTLIGQDEATFAVSDNPLASVSAEMTSLEADQAGQTVELPDSAPTLGAADQPQTAPTVPSGPRGVVTAETGANVRSGPDDIQYPIVDRLQFGQEVTITGRGTDNSGGNWWTVEYETSNGALASGWVYAGLITLNEGDGSDVPLATPTSQ